MNLRLDHKIDIPQLAGDLFRFIECRCDFAPRCRHIKFLQQLLGLIFVNVHQQIARAEVELACGTYMSNGFSLRISLSFLDQAEYGEVHYQPLRKSLP